MTRPPLELTVYPLCTDPSCPAEDDLAHYAEPIGLYTWHADEKAAEKRLTEPELAAEYWMFDMADFDWSNRADPDEATDEEWQQYIERRAAAHDAIHRFATLPHASENGYE